MILESTNETPNRLYEQSSSSFRECQHLSNSSSFSTLELNRKGNRVDIRNEDEDKPIGFQHYSSSSNLPLSQPQQQQQLYLRTSLAMVKIPSFQCGRNRSDPCSGK